MNRRLSSAALVAAAALTFSLASPTAATAAESATLGRSTATANTATPVAPTAVAPAAVSAANPVEVTGLSLVKGSATDQLIRSSSYVWSNVNLNVAVDPSFYLSYIRADLYVGGVKRETISSIGYQSGTRIVSWNRTSGYGATQLRNLQAVGYKQGVSGQQTIALPTVSNVINVKRGTEWGYGSIRKSGKKVTVKVYGWRSYEPNGTLKSLGKIKLQRKVKGKWRNVKNVRIKASGNGKIAFKQKKKYKYRLYYGGSSTIAPYVTSPSKKI